MNDSKLDETFESNLYNNQTHRPFFSNSQYQNTLRFNLEIEKDQQRTDNIAFQGHLYRTKKQRANIEQRFKSPLNEEQQRFKMYKYNANAHFPMMQQQQQHQRTNGYVQEPNMFENTNASHVMNNLGSVMNSLVNSRLAQLQAQQMSSNSPAFPYPMLTDPNQTMHSQFRSPHPSTTGPNQAQSNPNLASYTDESKCHVCGDKSTGSHFGGISCESCKAFFRRSVQKKRYEDYKCSYSGECKMNIRTRKICQFCRYKNCVLIGMKSKWVLSDDERHQKYGNRSKQKRREREHTNSISTSSTDNPASKEPRMHSPSSGSYVATLSTNTTSKPSSCISTPCTDSDEESSSPATSNSPQQAQSAAPAGPTSDRISSDCINLKSYDLSVSEKTLIDRLSMIFYHSRKHNSLDLNMQKKLGTLFQTQSQSTLKKMAKVILANFIVQPVKRVITFAKLITDFRELVIEDQLALLQGGTMELFICSSSSLYDSVANKFENIVSKERKIEGSDQSNIQLDMLRLIWSEEVFFKTIHFLKSMHEMHIDEATLILILPLILFSPDRQNLVNKKRIAELQSNYSLILKKYMIWKYGKEHAVKLFPNLLLKMIELRSLHEMHSSILLDADQSQLDPFPLALLFNSKEANEDKVDSCYEKKLKSTMESCKKEVKCKSRDSQLTTTNPEGLCNKNDPSNYEHQNSSVLTPDSIVSGPHSGRPMPSIDSCTDMLNNSNESDLSNNSVNISSPL